MGNIYTVYVVSSDCYRTNHYPEHIFYSYENAREFAREELRKLQNYNSTLQHTWIYMNNHTILMTEDKMLVITDRIVSKYQLGNLYLINKETLLKSHH